MADLPTARQFGDYASWPGRQVLDTGGERLGEVREIYLDRETHEPEWVLVAIDDGEQRFVPLADAAIEEDAIRVAHRRETVTAAPGIGAEPRIDTEQEHRLYAHYGVPVSEEQSSTVLPATEPEPAAPQAQPAALGAAAAAREPEPQPSAPEPEPTGFAPPVAATPEPEPAPAAIPPQPAASEPAPPAEPPSRPPQVSRDEAVGDVPGPTTPGLPPTTSEPVADRTTTAPPPLPIPETRSSRPVVPIVGGVAAALALLALVWRLRR
jgi:PRC-barrel domain protein